MKLFSPAILKLMSFVFGKLNPVAECRELGWKLWQCPPFLFLVMGFITIISMIATYSLASRYVEEPELAALIVIFITILFLIVGSAIISGFNRIAETNRLKSEFISLVSHQLRSPLSVFKWTLDVLGRQIKQGAKPEEENGENFLQTLNSTTENMIGLVNSLLEVSRIEARTFILRKETFSLGDLVRGILDNFRKYAEASHIALELQEEPGLPLLTADRERIGIVAQNLIDNAIRYTAKSGVVKVTIAQKNSSLEVRVTDQGIGIPKHLQKRIFEKFFRVGNLNKTDKQTHGSGIGLYIAKEVVEASGGKIGFTSEEGQGSTFWFTLPITN